jgi:hypothetical protein
MQRLKKRGIWKSSLGCGLALLLSGCEMASSAKTFIPALLGLSALPSISNIITDYSNDTCALVSPKALKQVNWTRVPEINMRIRNDEFEPMIVQMTQGWPYTFRIRNRDGRAHSFNAKDFFKNVAMVRITIDGKRQDETCFASLEIPAHTTAEMQLVAAVDGHFDFHDNWFPTQSLISGGADGVIIVEERRNARQN